MTLRHRIAAIILIVLTGQAVCMGKVPSDAIKQAISSYFQQTLKVSATDLEISYLHLPESPPIDNSRLRIVVESRKSQPQVGHQTLWLKWLHGTEIVSEQPITVDVTAIINIAVASKDIDRGEILSEENLEMRQVRMADSQFSVFRNLSQLQGMVASKVINKDDFIDARSVKIQPDIKRGQAVKVEFVSDGLSVITSGKAKGDSWIGEPLKVECSPSGKVVEGIAGSDATVTVKVK